MFYYAPYDNRSFSTFDFSIFYYTLDRPAIYIFVLDFYIILVTCAYKSFKILRKEERVLPSKYEKELFDCSMLTLL